MIFALYKELMTKLSRIIADRFFLWDQEFKSFHLFSDRYPLSGLNRLFFASMLS